MWIILSRDDPTYFNMKHSKFLWNCNVVHNEWRGMYFLIVFIHEYITELRHFRLSKDAGFKIMLLVSGVILWTCHFASWTFFLNYILFFVSDSLIWWRCYNGVFFFSFFFHALFSLYILIGDTNRLHFSTRRSLQISAFIK